MKKELPKQGIRKVGHGLPVIHAHAAGIDIGDTFHCIAIPEGQGGQEVKTITAYSCDLREIVLYLKSNEIQTVAMESTGIYWVVRYLLLEAAGLDPYWAEMISLEKSVTFVLFSTFYDLFGEF